MVLNYNQILSLRGEYIYMGLVSALSITKAVVFLAVNCNKAILVDVFPILRPIIVVFFSKKSCWTLILLILVIYSKGLQHDFVRLCRQALLPDLTVAHIIKQDKRRSSFMVVCKFSD